MLVVVFTDAGAESSSRSAVTSSAGLHREPRSLRGGSGSQMLQQTPSAQQPAIFATENSSVVTAQIGSTTTLPCTVKKFGNGVVSISGGAYGHTKLYAGNIENPTFTFTMGLYYFLYFKHIFYYILQRKVWFWNWIQYNNCDAIDMMIECRTVSILLF